MRNLRFEKRNVFFSSDIHFNHGNIILYCDRPFLNEREKEEWKIAKERGDRRIHVSNESIQLMNDTIINNINSKVGENDVLIHGGDFCFCKDYYTARSLRDRINCKEIYNIWGNHDHSFISDLFEDSFDIVKVSVGNNQFVMCHYPMLNWDKCHKGVIHLFGHCHQSLNPWIKEHMSWAKMIDIGVDGHDFKPLSVNDIINLTKDKAGHGYRHE